MNDIVQNDLSLSTEVEEKPRKTKILYIEDNLANQKLVERVLSRHNYDLSIASDGVSGINMAMEQEVDLILMDINLPDMDGKDITAFLKSKPKHVKTPIIALTADASAANRDRSLAVGCDGFITKPIDIASFPNQVAEYLGGQKDELAPEDQKETLKTYVGELVGNLEAKVKELEAANQKLKKLDSAKSDFIQLVSHELRTPLTILNGYYMLMNNMKVLDPDEQKKITDIAAGFGKGITRLSDVIQDVLSVSKITASSLSLSKGPIRLSDSITQVVRGIEKSIIQRNISIAVEDMTHLPIIQADGKQLGLAFKNIIGNSVKYTPDGGSIRIYPLTMKGTVTIAFQDRGLGVPLNEQHAIFEPFYRLENIDNHSTSKTQFLGGGLGLGLPIAKGIIEAHNGRVWVESPGRDEHNLPGSTFFVLLPAT